MVLYDDLERGGMGGVGREAQEEEICTVTIDSHCCTAEK